MTELELTFNELAFLIALLRKYIDSTKWEEGKKVGIIVKEKLETFASEIFNDDG